MSTRLLAQAVLAAALSSGCALAGEWTKSFPVSGVPELRVETDDAAITVRVWDESRIAARVTTSGWIIGPGEVEVHDRQAGGRVELTVRNPHRPFRFDWGHRWIHVELSVPRRIQADLRTRDGAVRASGLPGETRLHTGDGSIEADGLDGSLEASTGDGHVRVAGRLDVLTLHTGDGSIDADVLPGSRMSSGWRIETGDGRVTVRLPADFGAELDIHTGDGHISVDFPLTLRGSRIEKDLRAKINGGGAPFAIRTNDGSIRVGRL
ncbi:MAG: DUF4097 domain-containing protein [Acidobacteriia bacterium]|nr:DUF4097 domain-containing protein [Terriglobia bacterium]